MLKSLVKKITPLFLLDYYHFFLAFLGAFFYQFPSKKIKVIGVTGTNGKSSVINLASAIFKEAGFKTASSSSIKFKIGDKERPNNLKMTMPGRFALQKFLKMAVDAKCQYVFLEVTSEGIKQHRHKFIHFDVAVFTNLTPEHIESHGSFEKYKLAKGELFKGLAKTAEEGGVFIVNSDDKNADYFLRFPAAEKWVYGIKDGIPALKGEEFYGLRSVVAQSCRVLPNGAEFRIGQTDFHAKLLGEFNIYNSLAAICVALSQGIALDNCKKAIEKINFIPGRTEKVISRPFIALVDYAHTPDALKKVYEAVGKTKMICLLGCCGGGRDKWKRPEMGRIAAQYCQKIILTNEDPYDENPQQILKEIRAGITGSGFSPSNLYEILDRREAIKKALILARSGDTVIFTGKGSDSCICVAKGKRNLWNEKKVILEEFQKVVDN